MAKTILVTGATGKTGRRLVPLLQGQGVTVRAASRTPCDGQVRFDWREPGSHGNALRGVDAVYLIPPALVENPVPFVEPFVATAARAGVRRVVLLSSMGVEFPHEPQESGRRALEALVRASGLEWVILRPSGFMQNFSEGFLLPAIRHGAIPNPAGSGKVAMVDARDIAAVAAKALATEGLVQTGRAYDVTGPRLIDFPEIAETISRHANLPIAAVPMTSRQFFAMLENAGVPPDYAAMLVRDQDAIRDGAAATVADTVSRVLGRDPIDFTTFAAAAAGGWQQSPDGSA
jgi:uncharacterized protein YbjT (DUF2867 family)